MYFHVLTRAHGSYAHGMHDWSGHVYSNYVYSIILLTSGHMVDMLLEYKENTDILLLIATPPTVLASYIITIMDLPIHHYIIVIKTFFTI